MSELSKQALKVENNQEFPNNNSGFITPSRLRAFNVDMIDSTVNQTGYDADSGSWNAQIESLNQFTASAAGLTTGSLLITASVIENTITFTKGDASTFNITTNNSNLNAFTASAEISISNLNSFTQSANIALNNLALSQSSDNAKWQDLGSKSGSWVTESETGSFARYDVSNPWSATQNFTNISAVSASFTYVKTLIETASVIYSSGSNQFGDAADDIQTLYGSVRVMNALTASGLNYPTADNGAKSFMQTDGNGNLSFQYVDTIWETFYAGESVPKGTPLYFSGSQGANPIARAANAADPNKMPVVVIAGDNLTAGNVYEGIVLGLIEGLNLTGYTAGQTVYVAEGGGWTTSLPSGSNSITQVLGVVTKGGNGGKGLVLNPGPAQLPGLQTGHIWQGNGSNRAVSISTGSFYTGSYTGSFRGDGSALTGITASISIPILDEGIPQGNAVSLNFTGSAIGATVVGGVAIISVNGLDTGSYNELTQSFNTFTASTDSRLDNLEAATSSYADSASVAAVDAAQQSQIDQLTAFTGSVSSLATGSLLVTASATLNTITFTKGDATTFNVTVDTGSQVDISALNSFTASQEILNSGFNTTASFNAYTQSNDAVVNALVAATSSYVTDISALNTFTQSADARLSSLESATASYADSASVAAVDLAQDNRLNSLEAFTGSIDTNFVSEVEFGNYTSSNDSKVNSLIAATASYATTGSNTFIGDQTFTDVNGKAFTIADASGSLMLVPKGLNSGSSWFIAGNEAGTDPTGSLNILFKTNNADAATQISGSGNIVVVSAPPLAGFSRRLTGNNNIFNGGVIPEISSSMNFPINITGNVGPQIIRMRGPVTATAYTIGSNVGGGTINVGVSAAEHAQGLTGTLSVSNNTLNGTINIVAKNSNITAPTQILNNDWKGGAQSRLAISSSAMQLNRNTVAGNSVNIANDYFSGSMGLGLATINDNIIYGDTNRVLFTGSATAPGQVVSMVNSMMMGTNNLAIINPGKYLNSTSLIGQGLIVSASSNQGNTNEVGAVFLGRWNANDGIRNNSGEEILVVGTGTSAAARKTGLLIDSGSNFFIEGTLNVSGSTALSGSTIVTGSLIITGSSQQNVQALSITSNTASMDLLEANYFTLTLADTTDTHITATNIRPGMSATLVITTGTNSSASLAPIILEPSGSEYVATNGSAKKDVLSFIAVDSTTLYAVSTKNMI